MKKQKEMNVNAKPNKKLMTQIKDFLPSNLNTLPREQVPIKSPDNFVRKFTPSMIPNDLPQVWPGDEEANNFDFGLDSTFSHSERFIDPENNDIKLPISIQAETMGEVKWLRPEEYIRENYLEKEIKLKMPNRNHIKLRKKLAENYINSKKQGGKIEKDDEDELTEKEYAEFKKSSLKRKSLTSTNLNLSMLVKDVYEEHLQEQMNKEYFKFFEMSWDLKMVRTVERDETDEEFSQRKMRFEEKLKEQAIKNSKQNEKKNSLLEQILTQGKKKEIISPDISMAEKYPKYSKWVASVFQVIKDMNIVDPYTNETIFDKIYPQKDGVPIYNPYGKYWVKLLYMGKYRKIEVDDRMPCGKYEEYLLPRCEQLEELWPAILTKALLKLYSYKFKNSNFIYEEIGDASIFYSLTGYIGEKLDIDMKSLEPLGYLSQSNALQLFKKDSDLQIEEENPAIQIVKNLLSNEKYESSQKYLIGFNSTLPLEEYKEHFNALKGKEVEDEYSPRNILRKKNSIVELKLSEKKIRSVINSKVLKTLVKKNTLTLNSYQVPPEITNPRGNSLFMKQSIEGSLEKLGKVPKKLSELVNHSANFAFTKLIPQSTKADPTIAHKSSVNLISLNSDRQNKPETNTKDPGNQISSFTPNEKRNKSRFSEKDLKQVSANERINDQIYSDFAYSIVEYFYSNEFNMQRLKPVDFSDLRKKIQDAKVSYKQLTKDQKKSYINGIKELKLKQKEEKQKRLDDLKKPGKRFYLIKIKNNCIDKNSLPLNIYLPFTDEEVEMAKKCILNCWNFPPPSFFENTFINFEGKDTRELNISNLSEDLVKYPSNANNYLWTKDFYIQKILGNEHSDQVIAKQPLIRQDGLWIDMKDFAFMFKYFIILHNPKSYPFKVEVDNNWKNYNSDLFQPDYDLMVFRLSSESNTSRTNTNNPNRTNISNNKVDASFSCFLILFEPNLIINSSKTSSMTEANLSKLNDMIYYLNFELIDKNGYSILDDQKICLNNLFSSFQYDKIKHGEDYFLIIRGGLVPFGYYMKILSDHSIEAMSYDNYLKNYRGYQIFNFSIPFPTCEENNFTIITRIKCIIDNLNYLSNRENKILITSNKFPDNYLKQYIEIYMIRDEDESSLSNNQIDNDSEISLSNDLFFKDVSEKRKIYFNHEIMITKPGTYYFLFCMRPPFNISEMPFDLDILTNIPQIQKSKNLKFEIVENVDPYEISDKYIPNKHGLLFKELVYVPLDTIVRASLDFFIKIKDDSKFLELEKNVRMKLEIFKGERFIMSQDFFNSIIVHNLIFDNRNCVSVNDNKPFKVFCYLDLSECPSNLISANEYQGNVYWFLRVFASDSIIFVKNTLKEDHERSLKEGWEQNEPGRYEKARKARVKFLMQLRKEKGEVLSNDEELLLSEIRQRKKNRTLITHIQDEEVGNSPLNKKNQQSKMLPAPKNQTNDKAKIQSLNVIVEQNSNSQNTTKINFNKVLPTPEHHKSRLFKEFLDYAYRERVVFIGKGSINLKTDSSHLSTAFEDGNAAPYCRTEIELDNIREEINKNSDDFYNRIKKEIEEKLSEKEKMKARLDKRYKICYQKRNNKQKNFAELILKRNQISDKTNFMIEVETKLKELIKVISGNELQMDFQQAVSEYKDALKSFQSTNTPTNDLVNQVHELISQKKESLIKNDLKKFTVKDKANLNKHLEDIKINNWNISQQVLKELSESVS